MKLSDVTDEENAGTLFPVNEHINRRFDGDAEVKDIIFTWQYFKN